MSFTIPKKIIIYHIGPFDLKLTGKNFYEADFVERQRYTLCV